MILILKKRKSTTASTLPPSICHKVMGLDATIFDSVSQLYLTLCNPTDCSTPGFPVHQQFPKLAQMCVHWFYDAIQTSHPLLSPSPPVLNLSHHQSFLLSQFFTSGGQSIGDSASAWVLWLNIQDWIFIPLGWTGWISLKFKGLSRVFSNTTAQKHQFFITQLSLWPKSHIHTWLLEKP